MGLARDFIFWLSQKKKITDAIARRGMRHGFARRFVAGETLEEALAASAGLCKAGRRVSLNHLGENVTTREEAEGVKRSYVEEVRALHTAGLDGNISIKLTQLGLDLDRSLCERLTMEIAAAAAGLGRSIEMDMEGTPCTDVTLDIFEAVRRRYDDVCLAIQAYLFRSEKDIERLAPLRPKLRLVKGAYREPPEHAMQRKSGVDAAYRRLLEKLLDGRFFPAIATHDPTMQAYAKALIRDRKIPKDRYEFQMIYGVRRDLQEQVVREGHALRVYVPFGTEWCPYFMRRLAERPANAWFVVRSLVVEGMKPQIKREGVDCRESGKERSAGNL